MRKPKLIQSCEIKSTSKARDLKRRQKERRKKKKWKNSVNTQNRQTY